jgi:hypothetical protein
MKTYVRLRQHLAEFVSEWCFGTIDFLYDKSRTENQWYRLGDKLEQYGTARGHTQHGACALRAG